VKVKNLPATRGFYRAFPVDFDAKYQLQALVSSPFFLELQLCKPYMQPLPVAIALMNRQVKALFQERTLLL
jgi:hypothetical protein